MNMHVKPTEFKVGQRVNWTRVRGEFDGSTIEAIDEQAGYGWPVTIRATSGQKTYAAFSELELATKFAVGDKVRALETSYGGAYKKGNIYTIRSVSEEWDHLTTTLDEHGSKTNGWRKTAFEPVAVASSNSNYTSCAAAEVDNLADEYGGGKTSELKFVAGDRVRAINGTCLLEIGTEHVVTRSNDEDAWIDIDVDGKVRSLSYPHSYFVAVAPATATLTIQAGRHYKTRDGRKVGPMVAQRGQYASQYPFTVDHKFSADSAAAWREDGTFDPDNEANSADLISEWPDVATQQPTTMADIVRKHSGTAVVMLIEEGQPKPATRPYVHHDRASATTEAERLATTMPGNEFGVYELVTRRVADVVVREVA